MKEWMPPIEVAYDREQELSADVCVIGTGAGGAVLASELAEAGHSVIMLEKGGYFTRKDFNQREGEMMPLLFEDGGARTTQDGGITILHAACVGGSTTVNWAICFDPPEAILAGWERDAGLPSIRLGELRPHLDKVRRVLNVRPLEPHEVNENGRLLLKGAKALGLSSGVFEHNRTQCLQSGFCILGCAYDRKQSMLVTYVPRALHFGARLLPNAEASGFEHAGGRVSAVLGVLTNPITKQRYRVRVKTKLAVVAGGAIGTPRLLLASGLGNDRLGRNLRLHPTSAALGLFGHEVRGFEGIHYSTYISALEPEGIIIESVFAYPGLMGANLMSAGELPASVMARYRNLATAIVLLHDDGEGRVRVDGRGAPLIDYQLSERDVRNFRKGLKTTAQVYLAAGAEEVFIPHLDVVRIRQRKDLDRIDRMPVGPNQLALFSAHQMGTAAMHADPARGACDPWGRLHGFENLYVADASLFPTSIGVNPQLTIAAIASRTASHLKSKPFFG